MPSGIYKRTEKHLELLKKARSFLVGNNNGITLCFAHHPRKRAEEKRLSPYFMELVSVSKETL